jgi:drug/metabolite transporter (DMT)-like permease
LFYFQVTLLGVVFVCAIFAGVVLVIQPPFLFGSLKGSVEQYPNYFFGVLLAIVFAVLQSVINALADKLLQENVIDLLQLQLYCGIGTGLCILPFLPFTEVSTVLYFVVSNYIGCCIMVCF